MTTKLIDYLVLALSIMALLAIAVATPAHAKPCGHGHIAVNRVCHR